MPMIQELPSVMVKLDDELFAEKQVEVYMKRDDMIHPYVSGNKLRKLKYALLDLKQRGVNTVITFGGAYSNHIHAFSYAAKACGINAIGIIRGEELADRPLNPTLSFAKDQGMHLEFVTRQDYKKRNDPEYLQELCKKFKGEIIPEGGTQQYAAKGLAELVSEINEQLPGASDICCACGTGGTIAGIVAALNANQRAIGVLAVAGVREDVEQNIKKFSKNSNFHLDESGHLGGYAKTTPDLIEFIAQFNTDQKIKLEQVYTGKLVKRVYAMISNNFFKPGSKICIVHTGGMQGLSKELQSVFKGLFHNETQGRHFLGIKA